MNPSKLSGRKLDDAVAVKVFGWHFKLQGVARVKGWYSGPNYIGVDAVPEYSNYQAVGEVIAWLKLNDVCTIELGWGDEQFTASTVLIIESGRTLPIAVCRLALAVAMEKQQQERNN